MRNLFLILLLFISSHVSATSYYFSNTGNDAQDGKSVTTPWSSLKKLSEATFFFKPGDSLLFQRGSVFEGQINISTSGLYVGAYGTGVKPVISGSTEISGWIAQGKNIWRAQCVECADPANLFINGVYQPPGRYPNKGYRSLSAVSESGRSLSDRALLFTDGYWDNAEVVVKSGRWTIDNLPVKKYLDKTFTTANAASYPLEPGSGYFIQRHLSTLDQSGEWFYEVSTRQVYLFLASGLKPEDYKIRVSLLDVGLVVSNVEELDIENITLAHQRLTGVVVKNSDNVNLRHLNVLHSGRNGLTVTDCKNPCVEFSLITDSGNNAVEWHNNTGGTFMRNMIKRTGIHRGRGANGDGAYIAVRITADKAQEGTNLFQRNTIDSTGYIGIDFRTGNTIIRNNRISNFCLIKDDGGGIYTWNNTLGNNIIENNTIFNGIGANDGTNNSTQLFSSGIYIDDRSSNILIKNNEVTACATAGIFLHNAKAITVIGNRLSNNGNAIANKEKGQLYIKLDTLGQFGGNFDLQLDFRLNKLFAPNDASYCIYLSSDKEKGLLNLGKFSQNEFRAGRVQQTVAKLFSSEDFCSAPEEFSLTDWQLKSDYEAGSSFQPLTSNESFENISKNLIGNGSMNANKNGWVVWPENVSIVRDLTLGNPALKVNIPAGSSEALLYHEGFSLRKGALYRLSFSARSLQHARLEFVPLMADSPWLALAAYTCFAVGPTSRTFIYYFSASHDNPNARVNFKSGATFWIDNVSLQEVVKTKYPR